MMGAFRRLGEGLFVVGLFALGIGVLLSCYGRVIEVLLWVGGVGAAVGFIMTHAFTRPPPLPGRPPRPRTTSHTRPPGDSDDPN